MREAFLKWFEPSAFSPHGFCLLWEPGLIWLHAASDVVIALAYFSIPLAIAAFLRERRDFEYRWVGWLFAAFILACGTSHVVSVVTLWQPYYWLEGAVKAITALVSLATAVLLWPLIPKALALPSPAHMRQANTELASLVQRLERPLLQVPLRQLLLVERHAEGQRADADGVVLVQRALRAGNERLVVDGRRAAAAHVADEHFPPADGDGAVLVAEVRVLRAELARLAGANGEQVHGDGDRHPAMLALRHDEEEFHGTNPERGDGRL